MSCINLRGSVSNNWKIWQGRCQYVLRMRSGPEGWFHNQAIENLIKANLLLKSVDCYGLKGGWLFLCRFLWDRHRTGRNPPYLTPIQPRFLFYFIVPAFSNTHKLLLNLLYRQLNIFLIGRLVYFQLHKIWLC